MQLLLQHNHPGSKQQITPGYQKRYTPVFEVQRRAQKEGQQRRQNQGEAPVQDVPLPQRPPRNQRGTRLDETGRRQPSPRESQEVSGATRSAPIYVDFDAETGNNAQINFLGRAGREAEAEAEAGAGAEARAGVEFGARAQDEEADPNRYKHYE